MSTSPLSKLLCISFIIAFVVSQHVCLNVIPEYYMEADAVTNSACGEVINSTTSVYLRSQVGAGLFGGLNNYKPNQDCETTFEADTDYRILVQFPFFNLQDPSGNDCLDKLQLQENRTKGTENETQTTEQTAYANVTMVNVTLVCNGTGINQTCWNVTSNYTVQVPVNATEQTTYTNVTMAKVTLVCNGTGINETCWNVTSNYTVQVPVNATEKTTYTNVTMANVTLVCNGTGVNETCWNVTSNYTVQVPENTTQILDNSTQLAEKFELNTTVICTDPEPFVSTTNTLKIRFISDSSVQEAGICLLVTAYRQSPCNSTVEFLCDSNRCISKTLICDGVHNCIDKTDETKEHASCSTVDEITGEVSGLGKNVVIGIVVISAGIICTAVVVIMMSQFMNRDSGSSCTRDSAADEEVNIPRNITRMKSDRQLPPKSSKQKKSVTLVSANGKDVPERGSKRTATRKVAPAKVSEDEW